MSVKFKSNQGSEVNVQCLQIPRICGPIPVVALGQWQDRMRERKLQLVEDKEIDIDVLIGTRDYYSIVTGNCTKLGNNLMAIETVFGWTLHGTLDQFSSFNPNSTTIQDGENLKRFPRGEEPSSKEDPSQQCTRSRPLMTTQTPVSQRALVMQIASEPVIKNSGNPGRLKYTNFLRQEEERQIETSRVRVQLIEKLF